MVYYIVDMDGVLVEFRYKDKVNMTEEELKEPGNFYERSPVPNIIEPLHVLQQSGQVTFHSLSVSPNEQMDVEKRQWLDENVRFIPRGNMHFVRHSSKKGAYMEELYQELKKDHLLNYGKELYRTGVLLIDDKHSTLYEVEGRGFIAWHPTTLLNRVYHKINQPVTHTGVM